jgi:ectoine hydroxylase-related dioxygenase (phytanoyl-CoA dioxygenase family)|tara:strand:+ start:8890 stop:9732 length:843 start_codon:yes stop_codon:yes gene_type:complete
MIIDKTWLTEKTADINMQGYTIIENFLSPDVLTAVRQRLVQLLGSFNGRNNFEGHKTERIYTLVGRGKVFEDIVEDPKIMALCAEFLLPNFLLTANQAISIAAAETAQPFHTDDAFYMLPRPRPMISLSTIVAVDDFTSDNGGTQVVPSSHQWSDEKLAQEYTNGDGAIDDAFGKYLADQTISIEMPAGSCAVFAGTLLHRGGPNNSRSPRRAFSNQYCQPWARTQENFYLAIPAEKVARMSDKVQDLLGYSIHAPFMGQVSASHPKKTLAADYIPPVMR